MIKLTLVVLIALLGFQGSQAASPVPAEGYFSQRYIGLANPRALFLDESGDILAVGTSASSVFVVYETENPDGSVTVSEKRIVDGGGLGLNHGVTHHNGYIYASNPTTVYRWPYVAGSREAVTAQPETLVTGIPTNGHVTRTLIFDSEDRLYISVGSNNNIDPNSDRARIIRLSLTAQPLPINWLEAEVFADGLRNEVGLAFNKEGVLYGVENGGDLLNRPDLGGDIHNGNPAEEMNRFDGPVGSHYGYPYCFSTHNLAGYDAGTQFAWPTFMNDGVHSDNWCNTMENNRPPAIAMPAHMAPLGVTFYDGANCGVDGGFPCDAEGDAFVAFHGSWNSDIPVGYKVVRIPFTKTAPYVPTGEIIDILYESDNEGCRDCFRPVNAVFNQKGHLIVSADSSAETFKVTYGTPPPAIVNTHH